MATKSRNQIPQQTLATSLTAGRYVEAGGRVTSRTLFATIVWILTQSSTDLAIDELKPSHRMPATAISLIQSVIGVPEGSQMQHYPSSLSLQLSPFLHTVHPSQYYPSEAQAALILRPPSAARSDRCLKGAGSPRRLHRNSAKFLGAGGTCAP